MDPIGAVRGGLGVGGTWGARPSGREQEGEFGRICKLKVLALFVTHGTAFLWVGSCGLPTHGRKGGAFAFVGWMVGPDRLYRNVTIHLGHGAVFDFARCSQPQRPHGPVTTPRIWLR